MLCFEKRGKRLAVFLEGELDHDTTALMRAEIDNQLRDAAISELIIDMAGVSFMDSSGIGLVLGRYKQMAARRGCVSISRPGRRIDMLLKLAGVYELIERKA